MAAASSEFAAEQAKAMPKHMAAFVDIAKAAQAEAMDVMLSAGQAAAAAGNDDAAPQAAATAAPAAASTGDDAAAMADIKKDVMAKTAKK